MYIRTQLSAIERAHFPNSSMSCKIISASGAKRRFAPALKASPGAKSCFAPTLKVLPGVKSVFAPARQVLPGVKSCLAPARQVSPGAKSVFAPAAKALPGAKCRLAPGAKKIQYETGAFAFFPDTTAVSVVELLPFSDIRAVAGRLFSFKQGVHSERLQKKQIKFIVAINHNNLLLCLFRTQAMKFFFLFNQW
jgi:hypothetical protein